MNSPPGGLRFHGNMQALRLFIILSFFIHIFFLSLSLLFIKKGNHHVLPSPYVVNLVGPESLPSPDILSGGSVSKTPELESKPSRERTAISEKPSAREERLVSEKIEAIRAKKRIEQIAVLRNTISLRVGGLKRESAGDKITGEGRSLRDDYYSKITSEIWQHWVYPDIGNKEIEAIIVIKILKDGSVQIKGIEKLSGNSLFDRSAIRAITKASPLTPPPYEMEIGVRFYP